MEILIMDIQLSIALKELNITIDTAINFLNEQGYEHDKDPNLFLSYEEYNVLKYNFKTPFVSPDIIDAFNNSISKVIALRGNKSSDSLGFLKPVRFYENEFAVRSFSKEEREDIFKSTGFIILKSDYYEIYSKYEKNEFFSIDYEEDLAFNPNYTSSVKYKTLNGNSKSNKKLPLIIKDDISNFLKDGKISLPYKFHNFFFLEDNEIIYGPISVKFNEEDYNDDEELDGYDYTLQSLPFGFFNLDESYENIIFGFKKAEILPYIVTNEFGKNERYDHYITNTKHLVGNIEPVDYIINESNQETISQIQKIIPNERESDWVGDVKNNKINEIRLRKFLELKDNSIAWISYMENYLSTEYFNSNAGENFLIRYIEANKDDILEGYTEDLRKVAEEAYYSEQKNLEEIISQKEKFNEELVEIRDEISKLKEEKEIIKSKSEELLKIESKITDAQLRLKMSTDLESLRVAEELTRTDLASITSTYERYKNLLDQIKSEYSVESEVMMHKKLLDLKPYVQALNGYYPLKKSVIGESSDVKEIKYYDEKEVTLENYAENLMQFLVSNNRHMKKEDVVNYATNINQNFLTIYCGLPGVGKTSLGNLMNSFTTPKEYSLEIPVSRGWTSRKNLLGYFNPINGIYQEDEYGFVSLLKRYNSNTKNLDLPLPVLLDEANLSPMEHYWSDFISLSDKKSESRFLNIEDEGTNSIKLPLGLKFLCTINSDHTTELLSPRLIDRASIIKVNYAMPENDIVVSSYSNVHPEIYYRYSDLETIFNPKEAKFARNEEKLFKEILEILTELKSDFGNIIAVSPRKINSIIKYCDVTRELYFELTGNQFLNLDFCVLQHILPLISGNGVRYENRLLKLREKLIEKGLSKSHKELSYIIDKGKDYKNYTYFS